jgi:hypothetical protein
MVKQVDYREIEKIVGAKRHPQEHVGRFVVAEQTVYILHSQECRDMHDWKQRDLKDCPFSFALDQTDGSRFPIIFPHDRPFRLGIFKDPVQLAWKVCILQDCWEDGYTEVSGKGPLGYGFQGFLCAKHSPRLDITPKS